MEDRIAGAIAVSRSFGNFQYKKTGAVHTWLSSEPDVVEHELVREEDEFLIIATDGVWECYDPWFIVRFVRCELASGESPMHVAEKLLEMCVSSIFNYDGTGNQNMTVMIVGFTTRTELERLCGRVASPLQPFRPVDGFVAEELHPNVRNMRLG